MKDRLRELCDENKDLGSAMHLKWAKLAREAGLRKKVPDTKELNLTQVNHRNVLEFADIMFCVSSVQLNVIWSWEMKTVMFSFCNFIAWIDVCAKYVSICLHVWTYIPKFSGVLIYSC